MACLPELAAQEIARCVAEGLSARQTRLRLVRCGFCRSERAIARWMAAAKTQRDRAWQLQQVGIGAASVQADLSAATAVIRTAAPGWRQQQEKVLRDLLANFLNQPSAVAFVGLVAAAHSFLVSAALDDSLREAAANV